MDELVQYSFSLAQNSFKLDTSKLKSYFNQSCVLILLAALPLLIVLLLWLVLDGTERHNGDSSVQHQKLYAVTLLTDVLQLVYAHGGSLSSFFHSKLVVSKTTCAFGQVNSISGLPQIC